MLFDFFIKNGNIVFCDALNQTKKYLSLNCSKDPVRALLSSSLLISVSSLIDLIII